MLDYDSPTLAPSAVPRPARLLFPFECTIGSQRSSDNGNMSSVVGHAERATDKQYAQEAAMAVWRGVPVRIGRNDDGPAGIGHVRTYRPHGGNRRRGTMSNVLKFRSTDTSGRADRVFNTPQDTYADILSELRDPQFRVLAFSDPYVGRRHSEIHAFSIRYTAPVDSALLVEPVGLRACRLQPRPNRMRRASPEHLSRDQVYATL